MSSLVVPETPAVGVPTPPQQQQQQPTPPALTWGQYLFSGWWASSAVPAIENNISSGVGASDEREEIELFSRCAGPARNAPAGGSMSIKKIISERAAVAAAAESSKSQQQQQASTKKKMSSSAVASYIVVTQPEIQGIISKLRRATTRPPKTTFEIRSPVLREYMAKVCSMRLSGRLQAAAAAAASEV